MHEAGPASAQLHQGKAGEGEALCLLCAKRQVGLRADLRGGVLSECGGPFPAVPAGSGPFLLMLSPALGFTVTPLLSPPAVHPGCLGEVAPPPQHTDAGRKQEAVWVSLSSGPQVSPVEPSCRPGHTRAAVTVEAKVPA